MKEKLLWKRIKQDDELALKELFDSHYKPLCSYAFQFTKHFGDAEDIVQNEFVKLWMRRNKFVIHTSIKAYLYKSVYHAFLQQTRKEKKKEAFFISLKYEALSYRIDEDDTVLSEKIERIKNLLELLPARCKEILLLSKRDGLQNKEIADKLGISVKTVESQISIAFKKIRKGFINSKIFLILFRN